MNEDKLDNDKENDKLIRIWPKIWKIDIKARTNVKGCIEGQEREGYLGKEQRTVGQIFG